MQLLTFSAQSFSFVSLFEDDGEKAQTILRHPADCLLRCDEAAVEVQEQLCKTDQTVKTRVRVL